MSIISNRVLLFFCFTNTKNKTPFLSKSNVIYRFSFSMPGRRKVLDFDHQHSAKCQDCYISSKEKVKGIKVKGIIRWKMIFSLPLPWCDLSTFLAPFFQKKRSGQDIPLSVFKLALYPNVKTGTVFWT